MRYKVVLRQLLDGQWHARCQSSPFGVLEKQGRDRADVLQRMRDEIQYRIEFCPCSGVTEEAVEIELVEAPRPRAPTSS